MYRILRKTILSFLFLSPVLFQACAIRAALNVRKGELAENQLLPDKLKLENNNGMLIVPVVIDGKTYRFIYDTGAQVTVVSNELAKNAGLKKKGAIPVTDSQKNKNKLLVTVIPEIQLGKNKFTKVGAAIVDFSNNPIFSCFKVDGIIGMNILRNADWLVDFDAELLGVYSAGKSDTTLLKSYSTYNLNMRTCPYIELNINGHKDAYLLDLGKSSFIIDVSEKTSASDTLQKFIGFNSIGLFGAGKTDTIIYTRGTLSLDSNAVFAQQVLVQTPHHKTSVGTSLFTNLSSSLYLDFKRQKLLLNLRTTPKSADLSGYGFMPFITSEGQMIVGNVLISESHLLQLNDRILAVNEIAATDINACELLEEIKQSKLEKRCLNLKIQRDSQTFEFHIELIPLLVE